MVSLRGGVTKGGFTKGKYVSLIMGWEILM